MANLEALGAEDEIKFVISSRRDYEFAREFTRGMGWPSACGRYYFRRCLRMPAGNGWG